MTRRTLLTLALLAAVPAGAQTTVSIEYYHLDALGSVRVVTDAQGAIVQRRDYLPFGEDCTTGACTANPSGGTGAQPLRFTGKERDTETGLDYFGARYYRSSIGRFTTTDPLYNWKENLVDAQRWNRYAYGRNNPLRYVDPDGRDSVRLDLSHMSPKARAAISPPAPLPAGASNWQKALHALAVMAWTLNPGGIMPGPAIVAVPEAVAAEAAITMDQALVRGAEHVAGEGVMETTSKGNFQFRSTKVNAAGQTESRMSRFDVNPTDPHVQEAGPHLNTEVHVNGKQTANVHTPIDPKTIRPGDHP